MFILKVFSFFFICILTACGNSFSQTENTELSLTMKRYGCYGSCPNYDLTIQPDGKVICGKVIIDGGFWTKMIPIAEDKLNEEQLKQLIAEIEKANFFSFDDAYNNDSKNCPNSVSDNAGVILYIKLNGKEKTINHRLGCRLSKELQKNNSANIKIEKDFLPEVFPQELYNLENKIDEIVETKRWIGEQK